MAPGRCQKSVPILNGQPVGNFKPIQLPSRTSKQHSSGQNAASRDQSAMAQVPQKSGHPARFRRLLQSASHKLRTILHIPSANWVHRKNIIQIGGLRPISNRTTKLDWILCGIAASGKWRSFLGTKVSTAFLSFRPDLTLPDGRAGFWLLG